MLVAVVLGWRLSLVVANVVARVLFLLLANVVGVVLFLLLALLLARSRLFSTGVTARDRALRPTPMTRASVAFPAGAYDISGDCSVGALNW